MASVVDKLEPILVEHPSAKHTASVIFLHGAGSNSTEMKDWIAFRYGKSLAFPHIKMIYPNAPERHYTPLGMPCTVWFDWLKISPSVPEMSDTIDEACHNVEALIKSEEANGIPRSRIILGGLSMGGALAMYHGFHMGRDLAGIFALSSFLVDDSCVYKTLDTSDGTLPPFFQAHGTTDPLITLPWGKATHKKLTELGVNGQFHTYENLAHDMCGAELQKLKEWLEEILPD